ncbi:MAG: hypothetical protein GVY19_04215 [Bacteroidetes bacterium]|jgi:hypothetical protein|nr:hypothetical protein [Bacteroidota bacterium]
MRRILNIFLLLALLVLMLFTGLFFMVELKEDKIIALFSNQVEEKLRTQIELDHIDINLIRQFPHASIELENVVVHTVDDIHTAHFTRPVSDTLCYLNKVYLEFSLPALLANRYEITSISLYNGKINVLIDRNGSDNFTIVRPDSVDNNTSKTLDFDIKNIAYNKIEVDYQNLVRQIETRLSLDKGKIKTIRKNQTLDLEIKSNLASQYFRRGEKNWFAGVPMKLQGSLIKTDQKWKFNQLNITFFKRNTFNVNGFIGTNRQKNVDLSFSTQSANADEILQVIPITLNTHKWHFSGGSINANGTIKGRMGESSSPRVDILFTIANTRITDKNRDLEWKLDNAAGTFSNGSAHHKNTAYLGIDKADITLGKNNRIHLNGSIHNFSRQVVSINTNLRLNHEILNAYIKKSDYELTTGVIDGNLSYSGTLAEYDTLQFSHIVSGIREGNLHVKDVEINGRNNRIKAGGNLQLQKNWRIDSAYIAAGGNTINFQGSISEPVWLFQSRPFLNANVSAHTGTFDLREFITFVMNENTSAAQNNRHLKYNVKANAAIERLIYNKVEAEQVKVSATLKNNSTHFHRFESEICEGQLNSSGTLLKQSNGWYSLKSQSDLKNIDIHKLFDQFNNFRQDFLVDENIFGTISGTVDYYSKFDTNFAFQASGLMANADISINNGELVNFDPLYALSRFVDIEELKHVKFANMENNILIKEQTVFIPQMTINSSALDLAVWGKHYFDNTFDYYVQVKLAEILAHKLTNRKKKFEDVGYIVQEEGKELGIPLRISGNPDNYQVRYNRQQAGKSIKQSVQEEKKEFKNLFKKENSEKNVIDNNPADQETVKAVWPEDEKVKTTEKETKKKNPSFQIEWDD